MTEFALQHPFLTFFGFCWAVLCVTEIVTQIARVFKKHNPENNVNEDSKIN